MATRSATPQNYKTARSSTSGAGCFWGLFIVGGIAWVILLIFGPFPFFEAMDLKNSPNVNFQGYIVNKKTDTLSNTNFYVLELAPAVGQTSDESVNVPSRVYNIAQVGWYLTGTFESDDHLLTATLSDTPGGVFWAKLDNSSTEEDKYSTALVVTIIWGTLTGLLILGYFLRPKTKLNTVKVPSRSSRSITEGTLMIGTAVQPPVLPDLKAFPPGSTSPYFLPPQGVNNSLPPPPYGR